MTTTPVPILRSVAAAYAFLISHWQRALIAAAPYTLLYVAQLFLLANLLTAGAPSEITLSFYWMLWLVTPMALLALTGAMLRMAVKGDYSGRFGLKLGHDEWRIFLVAILVGVLMFVSLVLALMFVIAVMLSVAGGALERAGIDPAAADAEMEMAWGYLSTADWAVLAVVGIAALALVLWLSARVSMAMPATIDKGRVLVLSVWPLTNQTAWRVAAAAALTIGPLLLLEVGVYHLLGAALGERPFQQLELIARVEGDAPVMAQVREYLRWFGLMAGINYPLLTGLYAYIYRNRTENQDQKA
ncbi:hypothetical protein [Maricaulis sp.]|uniref:hypothetical protein n=1 Tax=Maricaulis sp. TaxID=1486257 RepID=UPI001B0336A2|nr:hypothetical protein [Maricaulis sp.]MBO6797012.1 hypothetical protein [Maricaulis sp.]